MGSEERECSARTPSSARAMAALDVRAVVADALSMYSASPADIERDVTRPLEDAVAGISGIDKLQGFARDSYTLLLIQFEMGTDLESATNAVRDRIGAAEGKLPSGAEKPVIQQIDIGALPVIVLALSTEGSVNATRALADEICIAGRTSSGQQHCSHRS